MESIGENSYSGNDYINPNEENYDDGDDYADDYDDYDDYVAHFDDVNDENENDNVVNNMMEVNGKDFDDDVMLYSDNTDAEAQRFYQVDGNLSDWVNKDEVASFISTKFVKFLDAYSSNYKRQIDEMVTVKGCSLVVDYFKFSHFLPVITLWLFEEPVVVLSALEKGAQEKVMSLYPSYNRIQEQIYVRISDFHQNTSDVDPRDITTFPSGKFVHIGGTVIHRSGVYVHLVQVQFECESCSYLFDPILQNKEINVNLGPCPNCQSQTSCYKSSQDIYLRYQKLTIQKGHDMPTFEVILQNDLVGCAGIGDEIEVTGIHMKRYGFPLQYDFRAYAAVIEANNVAKKEEIYLTDEDKEEIWRLSRDPNIGKRIIKSIAPSVVGHEYVKTTLALAMFGGREVNGSGEPILCRDINVLLLFDDNILKSQFLKAVEDTSPNAVRASAEKLIVKMELNSENMEWALEVSSPVLANNGVCIIDDLDQIYTRDREKIHNAMKNQLIDIKDVGVKVPLEARCSFIAAATPIGGRYDYSKVFQENVELEDPILSEFDVLCVVKDGVDKTVDDILFPTHMVDCDVEIIPQDMLKKYIKYARTYVFPRDMMEKQAKRGIPTRSEKHSESIQRLAKAHARMHLSSMVTSEDVGTASHVLSACLISRRRNI